MCVAMQHPEDVEAVVCNVQARFPLPAFVSSVEPEKRMQRIQYLHNPLNGTTYPKDGTRCELYPSCTSESERQHCETKPLTSMSM